MKLLVKLLLIMSMTILISCKDEEKEIISTGVSVDKYNELVKKHNELANEKNAVVTDSWK